MNDAAIRRINQIVLLALKSCPSIYQSKISPIYMPTSGTESGVCECVENLEHLFDVGEICWAEFGKREEDSSTVFFLPAAREPSQSTHFLVH